MDASSPSGRDAWRPFDAIVLAGGAGRRLGGVSKPDVQVRGRRLLDYALDATRDAQLTVVVGPPELELTPGVLRTLEDPPLGGPLAGIAAGLSALARPTALDVVLVLACDIPRAASAVPRLLNALGPDGACLVDSGGRPQWLLGAYRRAALERGLAQLTAAAEGRDGVRNAGARALLGDLDLARVAAREGEADDVDTWDDVALREAGE